MVHQVLKMYNAHNIVYRTNPNNKLTSLSLDFSWQRSRLSRTTNCLISPGADIQEKKTVSFIYSKMWLHLAVATRRERVSCKDTICYNGQLEIQLLSDYLEKNNSNLYVMNEIFRNAEDGWLSKMANVVILAIVVTKQLTRLCIFPEGKNMTDCRFHGAFKILGQSTALHGHHFSTLMWLGIGIFIED